MRQLKENHYTDDVHFSFGHFMLHFKEYHYLLNFVV
jgi:hypothetical protein